MKIPNFLAAGILAGLLANMPAVAQPASSFEEDQKAIQALTEQYLARLGACDAEGFADLFVPDTGAFASGFRGRMVGRKELIELVESERHCVPQPPNAKGKGKAKGRAASLPAQVKLTGMTYSGIYDPAAKDGPRLPLSIGGIVDMGTAEYQDVYTKTPQGWKFASRTVVIPPEKAAGLDAPDMLAIQKLAGAKVGEYYEPDSTGVPRLMTSGVRITVTDGKVTGRAFLKGGGYDDEVYEKVSPGQWRVVSSKHVPAGK